MCFVTIVKENFTVNSESRPSLVGASCKGGKTGTVRLKQIKAVSSLSSHSVTDDANNAHFIFSHTASSDTTEMKCIRLDELLHSDL